MTNPNYENYMVLEQDKADRVLTTAEIKLEEQKQVAIDAEFEEQLEQVAMHGDLRQRYNLLGLDRLAYLILCIETVSELSNEDLANLFLTDSRVEDRIEVLDKVIEKNKEYIRDREK